MARRGDEYSARIRAARAYADLDRRELGEQLGVSVESVSRLEAGTKDSDTDLRRKIADACEVPAEFMELGFSPLESPVVDERVEALERQMETVLRRLASAGAPAPPGELGRRVRAAETSAEDQKPPESLPRADSPGANGL